MIWFNSVIGNPLAPVLLPNFEEQQIDLLANKPPLVESGDGGGWTNTYNGPSRAPAHAPAPTHHPPQRPLTTHTTTDTRRLAEEETEAVAVAEAVVEAVAVEAGDTASAAEAAALEATRTDHERRTGGNARSFSLTTVSTLSRAPRHAKTTFRARQIRDL